MDRKLCLNKFSFPITTHISKIVNCQLSPLWNSEVPKMRFWIEFLKQILIFALVSPSSEHRTNSQTWYSFSSFHPLSLHQKQCQIDVTLWTILPPLVHTEEFSMLYFIESKFVTKRVHSWMNLWTVRMLKDATKLNGREFWGPIVLGQGI